MIFSLKKMKFRSGPTYLEAFHQHTQLSEEQGKLRKFDDIGSYHDVLIPPSVKIYGISEPGFVLLPVNV